MSEELFGITGATGEVGRRVAVRLGELGARLRLIVRDPSRLAPEIQGDPAGIVDYGDERSFREAAAGVSTLFLVSAGEHPERIRLHTTAVDAAVSAGVERIVYLSFLGAAPDATFTLARHHYATEEHIRATGVPFTFLRSSLYLDFIPWFCNSDGVIAGPAGSGRLAAVSRDDIADVVVEVLRTRGHDGATFDNTGPETFSLQEAADVIAEFAQRPIEYRDETLEEAWASRRLTGAPDWEIEGWVTSYLAIAAGELDAVADTVPALARHPARSLSEYLTEHPESYAHLLAS